MQSLIQISFLMNCWDINLVSVSLLKLLLLAFIYELCSIKKLELILVIFTVLYKLNEFFDIISLKKLRIRKHYKISF